MSRDTATPSRSPALAAPAARRTRRLQALSRWALFAAVAAVAAPARAQRQPASEMTGAALLALIPTSLAGATRSGQQAYSAFATAEYALAGGGVATLQIHDVTGAGAEAWQRRTCARWAPVGGFNACVAARNERVSLIWVFADRIQVMLGASDEATATRLARGLDLRRVAERARR